MRTTIRAVATGTVIGTAIGTGVLAVPAHATPTRTPWHVTIHADKTQVAVGKKVHVTGKVARSAAGRLVVLQEKSGDKPWKDRRNALVHSDGTYRTYAVPTVNRVELYRMVMPATAKHGRGVSATVQVVVYKWLDLTSLREVNSDHLYPESSIDMNATSFPASLQAYMYDVGQPTSQSIEYNLDYKCQGFRGYFGISDDSEAGGQASVTASADGTPWYSDSFSLGEYAQNSVTWATPPLKIRFDTTSLNPAANGLGAVGTPEVYCTQ